MAYTQQNIEQLQNPTLTTVLIEPQWSRLQSGVRPCADPVSFATLATTTFFGVVVFVDEVKYHYMRTIIDPPAKRHFARVLMFAFRWRD